MTYHQSFLELMAVNSVADGHTDRGRHRPSAGIPESLPRDAVKQQAVTRSRRPAQPYFSPPAGFTESRLGQLSACHSVTPGSFPAVALRPCHRNRVRQSKFNGLVDCFASWAWPTDPRAIRLTAASAKSRAGAALPPHRRACPTEKSFP